MVLLAFLLMATGATFASTVDVGASGYNGKSWANENDSDGYQQLAQQFTLNQSSDITSISLAGQSGTGTYDYEISNSLTGGTVYWSDSLTNPSGPSFSGLDLNLGAGTYYLLSLAQYPATGGWNSSSSVVEMGGTVQPGFWYVNGLGGTWSYVSSNNVYTPLQFDISGTTGGQTVPEPASIVLLASGLVSLGAALRRKLR
ncbi:MAG: PEP-CTERM sorting domain-containing protein [Terriglobia bacterium]|jgi:hypothetical protein